MKEKEQRKASWKNNFCRSKFVSFKKFVKTVPLDLSQKKKSVGAIAEEYLLCDGIIPLSLENFVFAPHWNCSLKSTNGTSKMLFLVDGLVVFKPQQ